MIRTDSFEKILMLGKIEGGRRGWQRKRWLDGITDSMDMNLSTLYGEGNGTPLQYSCLENPMDGGAWWAAVLGVSKSRTWLSDFTFTFHFHAVEKEMATHSSVLAWRIPGMGEPGGLPSMGLHRVGHYWSDLAAEAAAGDGEGQRGLAWCGPWSCKELDTTEWTTTESRNHVWESRAERPGGREGGLSLHVKWTLGRFWAVVFWVIKPFLFLRNDRQAAFEVQSREGAD